RPRWGDGRGPVCAGGGGPRRWAPRQCAGQYGYAFVLLAGLGWVSAMLRFRDRPAVRFVALFGVLELVNGVVRVRQISNYHHALHFTVWVALGLAALGQALAAVPWPTRRRVLACGFTAVMVGVMILSILPWG